MEHNTDLYAYIFLFVLFFGSLLFVYYFIFRRESSLLNPKNYNSDLLNFDYPEDSKTQQV